MKKTFKILFVCALFVSAGVGVWQYYESLPTQGAFDNGPISYPTIDKNALKLQLSKYSVEDLLSMHNAGIEAIKWQNLLGKVDATVISDVVKDFDDFFIGKRYPHDESVDLESQCSYFYHSHRPNEHGHFHVYFSNKDILSQFEPLSKWGKKNNNTHLVAISMHPDGEPIGLFIPNQWVTKDLWYKAEDMIKMLGYFEINHPYPSWPSNQWLNQMFKLFRPQLESLLYSRDAYIHQSGQPIEKLRKNKKVEIIDYIPISINDQLDTIEAVLDEKLDQENR